MPQAVNLHAHHIAGSTVNVTWSAKLLVKCYENDFEIKLPSTITVPRNILPDVSAIFASRNKYLTIFFLKLDASCECSDLNTSYFSNAEVPAAAVNHPPSRPITTHDDPPLLLAPSLLNMCHADGLTVHNILRKNRLTSPPIHHPCQIARVALWNGALFR
jgi:hypothetical protein